MRPEGYANIPTVTPFLSWQNRATFGSGKTTFNVEYVGQLLQDGIIFNVMFDIPPRRAKQNGGAWIKLHSGGSCACLGIEMWKVGVVIDWGRVEKLLK